MPEPPAKTERDLEGCAASAGSLPIGTRIKFVKTLESGPDENGPGNLYAKKGDGGVVTGHGCREGHWVQWDCWPKPFGAVLGDEFEAENTQI